MLPVLLGGAHRPEKWPDSMGQAKVIKCRLIEERSETFNEGFLSYYISSIINTFEKKSELSPYIVGLPVPSVIHNRKSSIKF